MGLHNSSSRVGSEEVHVEMSLKPLNPHIRPDDSMTLNLLGQLAEAADKVRNRHKRNTAASAVNGAVTMTEMGEPQAEA